MVLIIQMLIAYIRALVVEILGPKLEKLTPYFPLNSKVKKGDVVSLVIAIVIYVAVAAVLGILLGFIGIIPIVGIITGIISTLVWIYEVVGIVLAILTFIK